MSTFLKNTSIYTFVYLLPQVVGFLLLPIMSTYLSPEDFGIISSMEVLVYVLSIVIILNLDQAAYRLYFDYNDDENRKKLLGTLFVASGGTALILLCITFLLRPLLQQVFASIPFFPFYVYAILECFFSSFSRIPKRYLQISEQAKKFLWLSLNLTVIQTGLMLWFIIARNQGAEGLLKANLITALLFLPVYMVMGHKYFSWHFDVKVLQSAVRFSWPFIPTLLLAWVLDLSDRIFIERFFGLQELGIYGMGYKLSMAFIFIAAAFATAYAPLFYRLANSDDQKTARDQLIHYSSLTAAGYLLIVFLVALFAYDAVILMLDERYSRAYEILRIIIIAQFFFGIQGVTSGLCLMQSKKTKANMCMGFFAAVINIVLNFSLIPPFGIYGAAIATVLSFAILTVMQYQYSKRGFFIPLPWGKIGAWMLLGVGILSLYNFWVEQWFWVSLASKLLLVGIVIAAGFVKRGELMRYIRYEPIQGLSKG